MSANVESMFYVRTAPWHGLGTRVESALNSKEALEAAGLDWKVYQQSMFTETTTPVEGFKANVRSSDGKILGVVSDRYKIVQNYEAFEFTDTLLGSGVKYETAGSLQNGRKVWMLAKLPDNYIIAGDKITPYMVFTNSHDGSGAIKVAMTPIRVVCQNTLNLALHDAKRIWSTIHTGDIKSKLDEARKTLLLAEYYMDKLGSEVNRLVKIRIPDHKVMDYINDLIPLPDDASNIQAKNIETLRTDLVQRYFDAPDLSHVDRNAYRFINAVSDFATHAKPLRETSTFRENLFSKTIDGNPLIDKAYDIINAIA